MLQQHFNRARRVSQALTMGLAITLASSLSACQDSSSNDIAGPNATLGMDAEEGPDNLVYEQVEFLGNPLVSEVTIVKAPHDRYNRTQPYNTAEFGPQSLAFINAFRGDQPVVANTLGAVPPSC